MTEFKWGDEVEWLGEKGKPFYFVGPDPTDSDFVIVIEQRHVASPVSCLESSIRPKRLTATEIFEQQFFAQHGFTPSPNHPSSQTFRIVLARIKNGEASDIEVAS